MKVLTDSEIFTPERIVELEEHYEAKYVCESCVKNLKGHWVNLPVAIFYQSDIAKVPEGGSQWFGLFLETEGALCIVNAISAADTDIMGIVAENGDVIYSRYRHDYRWSPDKSVMIDGGRDYTKHNAIGKLIKLRIMRDQLVVMGDR